MGAFLVYILKSALCLATFYLFYRLLLSKETFYRFNRFALLGLLALSALLPLVQLSMRKPVVVSQAVISVEDWIFEVVDTGEVVSASPTWTQVLLLIYIMGILFFFLRNAYSLIRLVLMLRGGRRASIEEYLPERRGIRLIVLNQDIAPFSWMNYIVVSEADLQENVREILIHECAHIRHHHSWDLLLAEVCVFFQWFNPAAWLLKQELQIIHEFEADESVILEGVDARQYQLLLIKKAVGTRLYAMANNLNHSYLKKRIAMMMKERSNPLARLKYAYVLPLAVVAVAAFARPEVRDASREISAVKVADLGSDEVWEEVEEPPVFPGGSEALLDFISANVKYPEAALEAGVQGRVVTQFVVDKDGTVRDLEIHKGQNNVENKELQEEALRVIRMMPAWTPGKVGGKPVRVRYRLPVTFRLQQSASMDSRQSEEVLPHYPGGEAALYQFLARTLKYPADANEAGISGRVLVRVLIDKEGNLRNPEVMNEVYSSLAEEVLRVMGLMGKWNPGTIDGNPVDVHMVLPVTFRIDKDNVSEYTENVAPSLEGTQVMSETVVVGARYNKET